MDAYTSEFGQMDCDPGSRAESIGSEHFWIKRYALALVCVSVAFVVRVLLTPWLGEGLPLVLFVAAALISAAYGGVWPGVVAFVLGLFVGQFFSANAAVQFPDSILRIGTLRYFLTTSVGMTVIEILRRNRLRVQVTVRELRREIGRREALETELRDAKGKLTWQAAQLQNEVAIKTEELELSFRRLEGMLYHMAHNLRAPLRAVSCYAALLRDESNPKLNAKGEEFTGRISDAAKWMDTLITDLLAFGHLSYTEIHCGKASLKRVVESVFQQLMYEIKIKEARIEVIGQLPEVWASEAILEQVLFSLLDNALKFVAEDVKPVVWISAEVRGPKVRLNVCDNGIGVDPEYHERIFQAFEKLHASGFTGNGIGLAIVKEAVHRMNGEVGVESTLGKGSGFWLELPRFVNT